MPHAAIPLDEISGLEIAREKQRFAFWNGCTKQYRQLDPVDACMEDDFAEQQIRPQTSSQLEGIFALVNGGSLRTAEVEYLRERICDQPFVIEQ